MGAVREVAKAGWSRPDHLGKVLPRGGSGGDTLWFGNLGVDGSDDAKYLEGTRGFPAAGDGYEGSKVMGKELAKGRGG